MTRRLVTGLQLLNMPAPLLHKWHLFHGSNFPPALHFRHFAHWQSGKCPALPARLGGVSKTCLYRRSYRHSNLFCVVTCDRPIRSMLVSLTWPSSRSMWALDRSFWSGGLHLRHSTVHVPRTLPCASQPIGCSDVLLLLPLPCSRTLRPVRLARNLPDCC